MEKGENSPEALSAKAAAAAAAADELQLGIFGQIQI